MLSEYDDSNTLLRWYVYGNYIDEVLMMVADSTEYYYAHDHLYSPVALMDASAAVLERYEYDAYGKATIFNAAFTQTYATTQYGNRYLFTGRRTDFLDSGDLLLQHNRHRDYDSYTGRWLTHDPMGYIDGMNLYEYVKSNPVIYTDPYGMVLDPIGYHSMMIKRYLKINETQQAAAHAKELYEWIAYGGKVYEPLPAKLMQNWLSGAQDNPYPIDSDDVRNAILKSDKPSLAGAICPLLNDPRKGCGNLKNKTLSLRVSCNVGGKYYHAFGGFGITFTGNYKCKSWNCNFDGHWDFYDTYDWHKGLTANVSGHVIYDDWALLVEKYYRARPFEEDGVYEGSFTVNCSGKPSGGGREKNENDDSRW